MIDAHFIMSLTFIICVIQYSAMAVNIAGHEFQELAPFSSCRELHRTHSHVLLRGLLSCPHHTPCWHSPSSTHDFLSEVFRRLSNRASTLRVQVSSPTI